MTSAGAEHTRGSGGAARYPCVGYLWTVFKPSLPAAHDGHCFLLGVRLKNNDADVREVAGNDLDVIHDRQFDLVVGKSPEKHLRIDLLDEDPR